MSVRNRLICFVGLRLMVARSSAGRLSNDHCVQSDGRRFQIARTCKEYDATLGHFPALADVVHF